MLKLPLKNLLIFTSYFFKYSKIHFKEWLYLVWKDVFIPISGHSATSRRKQFLFLRQLGNSEGEPNGNTLGAQLYYLNWYVR